MKRILKSLPGSHVFLWSKEALILMPVISIGIIVALPFGLQAQSNCVAAPSGLVSWWPAEGDATDVADGNSGVLINGVGFIPGKVGQAFRFNGTNSYIEVPDAPTLQFTNILTIECWVKRNRLEGGDYLIEKGGNWNSGSQNFAFALHTAQFNYAPHFLWNGGWRAAGSIADTNWHHCAVVATNGQADPAIYVDGVLQPVFYREGSATIDLYPSTRPLHIGAQVDPSSGWFFYSQTDIDEMSIYDRGLSAGEIQAIYNAGSSGKCVAGVRPSITSQPTNQTVNAGGTATFTVEASGTPPLNYQWFKGTSAVSAATGTTYSRSNVQTNDAGNYSVIVSNLYGSVTSSIAVLTVSSNSTGCVAAPSGLVSWWPAEGDATDVADGNSGVLINGVGFIPGKVGQAFRFNGTNSYIEVPDAPTLQFTNILTIECWVKRNRLEGGDYLIEKGGNWNSGSQNFAFALHTAQFNYAPHFLWNGGWRAAGSIADTNWHHCAVVATNGQADPAIYVDGVLQPVFYREGSATIDLYPSTRPLHIGAQVDPSSGWFFYSQADIDEMSIYDRGLSAAEIQAIYNAGSSGKCIMPTGPSISTQPESQTITVGSDTTFSVVANGSSPLSYQWRFNSTNIAGATGTSFTVVNAQFANAGVYSVQVTNAVDSVLSSNAVLTVNPGPSLLQVANTSVASAGTVTVPVLLTANGTENALSFSLNFSTSMLAYAATILPENSRATLFVNESQTTNGRLGLALALPAGSTFPQGLLELAELTFRVAVVTNATSTPIGFADQPVVRQVVDVIGNVLPANYTSGNVSIAAVAYEADVSPRSTGDSTVTVADWVLIGRFAARFASPTNASEFQHADCAPRSTLGNGRISIADWVQAGRYAAGLDPLTPAGGPTAPPSLAASNAKSNGPKSKSPRQMKASDTSFSQGHIGRVSISLQAQGDENAVGFTLLFDSANLSYVGASLGNTAGGGVLNVNTDQTGAGRVGFALALSSGKNLPAGLDELINVTFRASDAGTSNGSVSFSDDVIEREISDAAANTLTADYLNGTITVHPLPSLRISQVGRNISLSWPSWATNFVLQQAEVPSSWTTLSVTPAIVNDENILTAPINGGTKFYRLYQAH